ncbi:MAG: hypothetical protein NVS1B14_05240 [Vulcanimicrobiaceae bacterium]
MPPLKPAFVPWGELCSRRGPAADSPPVFRGLYVRGSLAGLEGPTIAIVGTRAASAAGRRLARSVARELSGSGACILSGLALGIDTAAHLGALDAGRATIGILGGGHDRFFPRQNRELAARMISCGGAVCSPFPPEEPAYAARFLQRNAAVAALCDAVVVVEAPARSGALNTAGWAAGRIPVLVFPGDVDRPAVAGCLSLIRDGATLVRSAADILSELRLAGPVLFPAPPFRGTSALQDVLVRALEREPLSLDELLGYTDKAASEVLAALTELEFAGAIARREGAVFALTRSAPCCARPAE